MATPKAGVGQTLIPSRVIEKKRRGEALPAEELEGFFREFLAGEIPDYQMSAFLMAVFFQGLDPRELGTLLDLMVHSGSVLDLSSLPGPCVDKHSTGGVGDKISLVLAPLAAELGLYVPMMSGRGLAHTAGTLDKLDAIPGFRTHLPLEGFRAVLEDVGVAMIGQSEEIAPLDRRLYALRDATATVPSLPLIAASIISKKAAEGIAGLVLDVKTGAGSFLPRLADARDLARTMIGLGEGKGIRTTALITGMDHPLGRAVGNGLETREAFLCLAGAGPEDLAELTSVLVGEMLLLGGLATDPEDGAQRARKALSEGRGVERMARMVERQGGDPRVVADPSLLPSAPAMREVPATTGGFAQTVDPVALGYGVVQLGGGRRRVHDPIDHRVGFVLHARPGEWVEPGAPLGEVHAVDDLGLEEGARILQEAVVLGPTPSSASGLIRERHPRSV